MITVLTKRFKKRIIVVCLIAMHRCLIIEYKQNTVMIIVSLQQQIENTNPKAYSDS